MIFSIIVLLTDGLTQNLEKLSLLHAPFLLGLVTGGAVIYWFTGASTQAVTTGAYRAVEFIKANIKLEGVEKASVADSKKVVEICTQYAQKGMFNIFLTVFFSTLAFAFVEPYFFIGYLISIALFGLYQAVFMANAGGAWDNAKKIVETELKMKNTPLHAATVVGDTVGDPFKDTSSVALNPVIKFTTLFGLLAVELAVELTARHGDRRQPCPGGASFWPCRWCLSTARSTGCGSDRRTERRLSGIAGVTVKSRFLLLRFGQIRIVECPVCLGSDSLEHFAVESWCLTVVGHVRVRDSGVSLTLIFWASYNRPPVAGRTDVCRRVRPVPRVEKMFGDIVDPSVKVGTKQWYTIPLSILVHTVVVLALVIIPLMAYDVLPTPPSMMALRGGAAAATAAARHHRRRLRRRRPSRRRGQSGRGACRGSRRRSRPSLRRSTSTARPASRAVCLAASSAASSAGCRSAAAAAAAAAPRPCASAARSSRRSRPGTSARSIRRSRSRRACQGVVIIEATIGPTGKVQDARVLRSIPLLDAAALDAVRQWEFTPTLLNGVPVPVIMTVTVQFTLS